MIRFNLRVPVWLARLLWGRKAFDDLVDRSALNGFARVGWGNKFLGGYREIRIRD